MRAQPRRATGGSSTGRWAVLGLAAGVLAAVAAIVTAPAGHRFAVELTVAGALVLWSGLLALSCRQVRGRARVTADLEVTRYELTEVTGRAAVQHAELSATHTAAARLRAALATAEAEREALRAELHAAAEELREVRADAGQLREAVERAGQERAELDELTDRVLPEVLGRLRSGSSVETALAGRTALPHAGLLRTVATEVGRGERQRAAALAVCATAAGRVQALATSMHAELREMQHRHGEDVLGDLLTLDHSTAQAGRMADSIAVLTGARTGRRWTRPIAVESVLRGALGRIGGYRRVRLHSASTAAVAGFAAEGVMHLLAELLDNAVNFSAPPAEVHVYVEEAHSGLVVTVEDGGLGLGESWLTRAERAVSAEPLDLASLSSGTRLGLAVVGVLARKHGLQVSFRPSARGGTGVVVLIPEHLVTHPAAERAPLPLPAAAVPAVAAPAAPVVPVVPAVEPSPVHERPVALAAPALAPALPPAAATTENGLPQRRRGQTLSAARASATASAQAPTPAPETASSTAPAARPRTDAAVAAARFGAFRRAVQSAAGQTTGQPADQVADQVADQAAGRSTVRPAGAGQSAEHSSAQAPEPVATPARETGAATTAATSDDASQKDDPR
ncbi:ATP-binding protein [Kitasatospora sp. NPDC096147]|uniref:sensor histidine kinase n=1 Tax=Kitasatospora sp. NPDC096147 TaxID=3364093 RepID=UPI0037F13139